MVRLPRGRLGALRNDYGDVDGSISRLPPQAIRSGSWSMRTASGSSTRVPISELHLCKYGRAVLAQPGNYAWQVFDSQTLYLLRDEYKMRGATKVRADFAEELVNRMQT